MGVPYLHINVHRGPGASGPHPLASIKCHPPWGSSDLHFSGPIFGVFSASFSGMFGTILEDIFRAPFHINHAPKLDPFLDDLLEALGDHQRRLLGVLGSLVGGSVFQIRCKKQYETHGFKNTPLRNPGFLEPLSEAILQYFIGFWIPE